MKELKAFCTSLKCVGKVPSRKTEKLVSRSVDNCPDCGNLLLRQKHKSRFRGKKIHRKIDEFDVDPYKTVS